MLQMMMLKPLVALAAWTMVMWLWLYLTRLPALSGRIDVRNWVGGRGSDLDAILPPEVQWKAHNYNHLMEQPTVFYAVVLALAVSQNWSDIDADLAWAYVGLRIAHSLVQALVNRVVIRFTLFALSSLVLIAMVGRAITQILLTG